MARARNIKPAFFKNEVLAEMPMEARMLFIGLWTLADREGRLEDRPKRIKMELFPYDSFDVDPMLIRLHADGFLTRYDVGGVRFIQIENFVKHQDPHYKEKASEIPPPEGVEDIIKATAVTRGQRVRILERDGYRCQSCGAESHLCIDHVIPVSRGGDSSDDNLQVLCHSCNTKKGNKLDGEEKGQKKSIHRPGAVIARPNVGSNSNQQKCTSPSDSLSSDSLIPSTLIPDPLKETAPRKRVAPPAAIAKPDDVDQQTWGDWVALRTKKRATVSITVVEEARRECAKAGLTLERFLQVWCMRGSQGLEAAWLKPDERGHATGETAYQRSMRERIEEAAPSIARRAPAQQQDATDYFRTVDVPARDVTRHAIEVQP